MFGVKEREEDVSVSSFTLRHPLFISLKFEKFFVLCGNNVIKTILGNINIRDIIFRRYKK